MYIEPGTNIRILHNVPLDNTYTHTLYFYSLSEQSAAFIAMQKYNLTNYSYQRVRNGVARVGIVADNLYDCNYMMFQNTNFGSKWFYAFITGVEYINNECSEITFEIDVMQTWFFDYDMEYCFVEREHSVNDTIGGNIVDEPVQTGEMVMNDYKNLVDMRFNRIVLAVVDTNETIDGNLYDGVYGAAQLFAFEQGDIGGVNDFISTNYAQKPDAIISIYLVPNIFIPSIPQSHKLPYASSANARRVTITALTGEETLNGYTPKNKKLYTYPFNYYKIDNAGGQELNLRYEFFENQTPVIEIEGTITQPVSAVLRPCSYKGVPGYDELGGYTTYNDEMISLDNYPVCSWAVDSYQAWVAQNSVPLALSTSANVASVYAGLALMGASPVGAAVTGVGMAANLLSQAYQASIAADQSKGSFTNGGGKVSNYKQQFFGGRCSVNAQYAEIIDNFFTMYGYATKKVKVPNRNSRPHWNYVKTVDCNITGSVPADDMRKISSIYDKGVTFWKSASEVGNYGLDNSAL